MPLPRILLIKGNTYNQPCTLIKKYLSNYTDESFRFVSLPYVKSAYEKTKEGRIFREELFYKEHDLAVIFIDMLSFRDAMMLALDVLEFSERAVIVIENAAEANASPKALSFGLGAEVIDYRPSVGIHDTLDQIRSYAASLLYSTSAYINYGYDLECAIGFIESETCKLMGFKNPQWAAVRLLEEDIDFLGEIFLEKCVSIEDRRKLFSSLSIPWHYLNNCTPGFDVAAHVHEVKTSLVSTLYDGCFKESSPLIIASQKRRAVYIFLYALMSILALVAAGFIFFD